MAHFAFLCVPAAGHLRPLIELARELVRRGHQATFFHHQDVAPLVEGFGLAFRPIGNAVPAGSLAHVIAAASKVSGPFHLLPLIRQFAQGSAMMCDDLPDALRKLSIDAIVGDWIEPAVGLVAMHLRLPYVSVAAALPLNWEVGVPSPFVGWPYGETRFHIGRNIAAQHVAEIVQRPLRNIVRTYAARWSLGDKRSVQDCASGFAQIAQLPRSLDYPRRSLIGCFHYCGPLRAPTPSSTTPRRRTGRAFASLGSLQGHRDNIFELIAKATAANGLSLTIAHGGRLSASAATRLARGATVRDFVAYDEIFAEVDVAILHGGMNGTLDALAHGVPTVMIPLAYEQAAIAERTRYAGVGLACPKTARAGRLTHVIGEVLRNPAYAAKAAAVRSDIRAAGGVVRAADIVEQVQRTGQPCLNADAIAAAPELACFAFDADRLETLEAPIGPRNDSGHRHVQADEVID